MADTTASADKNPPNDFRFQITVGSSNQIPLEVFRKVAAQRSDPELAELDPSQYPAGKRGPIQDRIRRVICEVVREAAEGGKAGATGYVLSDQPEPFFQLARTEAREKEKESQADAIRRLLRIKPDAPIVLSELDLVNEAVRLAREQNRRPSYGVEDLIAEGVRMIAQSIISKAVAAENTEGRGPDNLPGASDEKYMTALNKLRALRADPEKWIAEGFRKPNITVSLLAREARTNDVQIRSFIKRHGVTDVEDPKLLNAAKLAEGGGK